MCGIVSIHSTNSLVKEIEGTVKEMMDFMFHRGPDGSGITHIPNQAIFGHRRLAVIDLERGQQPMVSVDSRYTLIFNGEIYNYLELREELEGKGVGFKTDSDTEVLLAMLINYGEQALIKLNGMFAFVFHDRKHNQWIAARDPFGIKPLYFAQVGEQLIFASEIKAILVHPDVVPRRNNRALHQYLAFQFCLDEQTLFEGINKVLPGHYFLGLGHEVKQKSAYWDPTYRISSSINEGSLLEEIRHTLEDSIRLQLRSDVPLGAYLSGGLDSSIVSIFASKESNSPLSFFHGKFEEDISYDESRYAKIVAKEAKGALHEIIPSSDDFVRDLPKLIYALDEPVAGPGLFPQYAVSQLAKEHAKVVLGGQGGDEIFGGYARYLVGYLEQALKGSIFETQEEGEHLVSLQSIVPNLPVLKEYVPLLSQFWKNGLFEDMDQRYFRLIDRSQGIKHLLHEDMLQNFDKTYLFSTFQKVFNHPDTLSYINKMTHFDQKTLLPALLQVEDRVSMNVSLESRVPFLDTRLVDLVTTAPPTLKFQGGKTKHLLKRSMGDLVPREILQRKDKMGFPVPIKEWMQGGVVREFVADTLLSSASRGRGVYSRSALERMITDPGVGGRQLWGALSLELWHLKFIDS
tara:strand:+ start:3726 stop:5618 length:1893 start_codon:yes stop_codon:yes gene_type:complete